VVRAYGEEDAPGAGAAPGYRRHIENHIRAGNTTLP